MSVPKEALGQIRTRAAMAVRKDFRNRLYQLALKNAGFTDEEAGRRMVGQSQPASELPDYPSIEPARLDYGVSNPLADDARINTMALTRFRPDFVVHHSEVVVRELVQAWIKDEWDRGRWAEKILAMDSELPVWGYSLAHVGMESPGKVGWKPYSALTSMWDPVYRLPKDWRYVFFMDELDVDGALEQFPDAPISAGDVELLSRIRNRATQGGSDTDLYKYPQVRVWRYWTAESHVAVIGGLQDPNAIWLRLDDNMEYERMDGLKDDVKPGPNPYKVLPVAVTFEMVQPHVTNAVSRSHWEEPLAAHRQLIEKAWGKQVELSNPKLLLDMAQISDKALADKIAKGRSLRNSDLADVLLFDGVANWEAAFKVVPGAHIDPALMQMAEYTDKRLDTASGVSDAQKGERTPGEKTAYEVATMLDEAGLQLRHATGRKAQGLLDLITLHMKISAEFDTEQRKLTLSDGRVIDTQHMPLGPILRSAPKVTVSDQSLSVEGEQAIRARLIQETLQIWLPGIQMGALDPSIYINWLAQQLGYTDPAAMGIKTPEQVQAAQQQQAQAQAGGALAQQAVQGAQGQQQAQQDQVQQAQGAGQQMAQLAAQHGHESRLQADKHAHQMDVERQKAQAQMALQQMQQQQQGPFPGSAAKLIPTRLGTGAE